MKNHLRGMTLAALLLPASASAQAETNEYAHAGDLRQGFAGDLAVEPPAADAQFVGTILPAADADTAAETAPATEVGSGTVGGSPFAPVGVGDLQPASFLSQPSAHGLGCDHCASPGCDGAGCDGFGRRHSGLGELWNLCGKDGWIRAEAMLMFMAERDAPPLVTSAAPGVFPVLPNAAIDFGDDLEGGLSGGFRGDLGRYLTHSFGVGGRVLWVGENGDDFSASGDQNDASGRSLGRPYFFVPLDNPGVAQEDAVIVSQQNLFSGSVQAEYDTELVMADAYGRLLFCRNKASRLEMIAGYTFAGLDDMISITSFREDTDPVSNPTLEATEFSSLYDTENRFHGGQLGFETVVSRGCWTARALTKVHLGNMEQTVTKLGRTNDYLAGEIVSTQNSSILIDEEQGTQSRDVFTFIPELDFTLGYRFRKHVSFTVGYTFLYFDNVAMAGDQIDRLRDTSNIGENVTPVAFDIVEGNHWVQGISLGASIDY